MVVVSPACDSIISGQGTRIVPAAGADRGVGSLWCVGLPTVVPSPAFDIVVGGQGARKVVAGADLFDGLLDGLTVVAGCE